MTDHSHYTAEPEERTAVARLPTPQPITEGTVKKGVELLLRYQQGKSRLENRIVSNEEFYRLRHWREINPGEQREPESTSAWLLNSLMNKHADLMDNIPSPAILAREESDQETANILGEIVPVVLDRSGFDEVYDRASWYKLKHGTACYGVFWDKDAEDGLGEICVRHIDLLSLFWDPTVCDLQDSPHLFLTRMEDVDAVNARYPGAQVSRDGGLTVTQYRQDESRDLSGKVLVVDWYYRKNGLLHLIKFAGGRLLYATENDAQLAVRGLYDHGRYPVVLDVLFPAGDAPCGFGFIDVMRDPQVYIDKLDSIILKNARLVGKPRWFYRDSCGINEQEFADWERDFIHVAGRLEEGDLRQVTVNPLPALIANHREAKINEMKETSANRDVSSGGTASGVTAASAIAAMQEAGNKVSRDLLKGTYRAYKRIVELVIELMRQFYDTRRTFRILAPNGEVDYVTFQNDVFGGRQPIYDIEVSPQKSSPFNRLSQNEFAKELYSAGIFNPQMADQALAMLDMMEFEGKNQVIQRVQQGETLFRQVQQLQAVCARLAHRLGAATGENPARLLAALQGQGQPGQAGRLASHAADGAAQAYQRAADLAQGAEQRRIEKGSPL